MVQRRRTDFGIHAACGTGRNVSMVFPVTEHIAKSARHTTFYLAGGGAHRPVIIFGHGVPELSPSWRHQLPCFVRLGFRAIAPDMRGYGRSSVYHTHADYALEQIVQDMLELLDAVGQDKAVWVGHDWGSPVVWSLASHHPDRCHSAAPALGRSGGGCRPAPRDTREAAGPPA